MKKDIKSLKSLKKELFEYAKSKNYNEKIIGMTREYWYEKYNVEELKLNMVINEICKIKDNYIDYKENHRAGTQVNKGLDITIKLVLEFLELPKNEYRVLYSNYAMFQKIYPELKYNTFTRAVRRSLFETNDRIKKKVFTDDELKIIKEKIKKYFSDVITQNNTSHIDKYNKSGNEVYNRMVFEKDEKPKSFKRMVVLSDLHCGHIMGLTPPQWQFNQDSIEHGEVAKSQKDAWEWYINKVNEIGSDIDILVVNGDMIDGRGERSGGTELITTDRLKQVSIATECLGVWNSKQTFMTRGTPYHTGKEEQFEDVIAENLGAYIDNTLDIKVNGKIFNFRHKVGNSSVPYGKSTQVIKESIWNLIQSVHYKTKSADVIIRSHVHYMTINQDDMRYSITTPCLQMNSRYGEQQCSGLTTFGFIVFDIYDNGHIIVNPHVAKIYENEEKNIIEV